MSSNKKNQEVPTIEKVDEVVGTWAAEKVTVNPIDAKIATLTVAQHELIIQFKALLPIFASKKVLYDAFKVFMQQVGLYETSTNQAEVDKLQTSIANAKSALTAAGFATDSPIVQGAIKGLVAELTKAQKEVNDNLVPLATYFGVELTKKQGERVYANTGQLAMHNPNLQELKSTDYLFHQNDKKAVIVHSSTVAQSDLDTVKIKPASDTWIAYEFNGELTFDKNRSGETEPIMLATVKTMPENFVKAYPVIFTGEKLSGLMGVVAATLGLNYNGNGWQSNAQLAEKFNRVGRVIKEA
jgi:hypothetical protein